MTPTGAMEGEAGGLFGHRSDASIVERRKQDMQTRDRHGISWDTVALKRPRTPLV
jgi:hypothetical protein